MKNPAAESHEAKRSMPTATKARTCIMVLGMHRSGTSALTRVISLLGAELPKNLLGANPTNQAGHWEPQHLISLHDQMLSEIGSRWDDWRALDFAELPGSRIDFYRSEIARILSEEYGATRLMVLKEPRISRFVPLYSDIFQAIGIDVRYVVSGRNPLAVTESLTKRDGFTKGFGALLWLRHQLEAEFATRSKPRVFVPYESLMEDWRSQTTQIAKTLSLEWPRAVEEASADIESFLSRDLRHHVEADAQFFVDERINKWVKDAYAAIKKLEAKVNDRNAMVELDRIRSEFDSVAPIFGDAFFLELQTRQRRFGQVQSALQRTSDDHAKEAEQLKTAATELHAKFEGERARLQRLVDTRDAKIKRLLEDIDSRVVEATEREDNLTRQNIALQLLSNNRAEEIRNVKSQADRDVAEAKNQTAETKYQYDTANAELSALSVKLEELKLESEKRGKQESSIRKELEILYGSRTWRLRSKVIQILSLPKRIFLYFAHKLKVILNILL